MLLLFAIATIALKFTVNSKDQLATENGRYKGRNYEKGNEDSFDNYMKYVVERRKNK